MQIDNFSSLYNLSTDNAKLAVPGIEGRGMAGCICWLDESDAKDALHLGSRPNAALTKIISRVSRNVASLSCTAGWVCTLIHFPKQIKQFVASGWSSTPISSNESSKIIWKALPSPDSKDWEQFWDVPIDPVFTNVLILRGGNEVFRLPSEMVVDVSSPVSTWLPWPWALTEGGQSNWLKRIEPDVKLLLVGIAECKIGIQIIVPMVYQEALVSSLLLAG